MPPTTNEPAADIVTRDLLAARDFQAIANPVNCVGTMGAGLAKQFARRYPELLPAYRTACRSGKLRPGRVMLHRLRQPEYPHYVINFPTKDHYNGSSRLAWIEDGLRDMYPRLEDKGIGSVALPALGAGYGQLPWEHVRAVMLDAAARHPSVLTTICLLPPAPHA